MVLHDPKIIIMPAVILPRGGITAGYSATDAIRSQVLYSWLHLTGMDRMEEISFRW